MKILVLEGCYGIGVNLERVIKMIEGLMWGKIKKN